MIIRMGAAHFDITTPDGEVIDLSSLSPAKLNKARRIVAGIYKEQKNHG